MNHFLKQKIAAGESGIMDRYINNLNKTLQIIDLCFNLKEAYFRQKYPQESDTKIRKMIYQDILARKEKSWKSEKACLIP